MVEPARLRSAYRTAREALLAERTAEGYWVGELSASALSTATAVAALAVVARTEGTSHDLLIEGGLRWLADHQNPDGGWGDTVKSVSNISTTMLCRAAFHATGRAADHREALDRCESWLFDRYGRTPGHVAEAVRERYGTDRTFSVPILMMCALAGLVPWKEVKRLPFELACVPQSCYRLVRMPVVSYALPALIAIGQVVHHHRSTWNPVTRLLRWLGRRRSLRVLERIQPSSGGYLEAAPLTSFVVMSLAAMRPLASPPFPLGDGEPGGLDLSLPRPAAVNLTPRPPSPQGKGEQAADRVIARGVEFLVNSVRSDGSWPIDSNLSVWLTTLSINAVARGGDLDSFDRREELLSWLLDQQTKDVHPYTGAAPGAWGWSHLPGSVPDCDDTPGALLAVRHLGVLSGPEFMGVQWILNLQNRDGGMPTFCRGWGRLPFDRSGTDLTAHSLRAINCWSRSIQIEWEQARLDIRSGRMPWAHLDYRSIETAVERAWLYLARQQRPDGSWLPLWFGNQYAPDDTNPVYGTARVLAAYRDLGRTECEEARRGTAYLLGVQNADGGWGGARATPSSVEETAVAVEVLLDLAPAGAGEAVQRGLEYLVRRVEDGTFTDPSPIGFYFARLWYFEKLYPVIFTVAALGRATRLLPPEVS